MIDLFVDLLLYVLGKRKKDEAVVPKPSADKTESNETPPVSPSPRLTGPIDQCVKCGRTIKYDTVFEKGTTWCPACYKTHLLKIRQ